MLYSPVQPMHIPDGFLSTLVAVVLWVVSIGVVAYALRRVGKDLGERQVPLMGVLAAAIFAGSPLAQPSIRFAASSASNRASRGAMGAPCQLLELTANVADDAATSAFGRITVIRRLANAGTATWVAARIRPLRIEATVLPDIVLDSTAV